MATQSDAAKIHCSVLPVETLEFLAPHSDGIYVDGTLGLGGHSEAILQKSSPDGRVIAFDWDEAAIEKSRERLKPFGDRLTIIRRNFSEIAEGLGEVGIEKVDGILIDIGLSSLQLDMGGRGFSFQRDEPLDMRMDIRREVTAASILADCTEQELADIFYYYGEEKQARRIASYLVKERKLDPFETSKQFADLVARAVPRAFHPKRIHVATRVFQALRIAVNTELENLATILESGVSCLAPGARFCVISFHSLEDRMVKRKFRENTELKVLTKKPIVATPEEQKQNRRSRSARMRVAEKI
ncbi:MAG: 16S rRNA (cytosine(1402)-N(4))-methyltransferase RsmH [Thermodesulfobacteriota bacterium]|nr:16S rRNA (cytosine(1402)-N(4))-methyltransferase RsmH [Thermodesulfobacteriota bacterium]